MDCHGRIFYIDHKNHKTTWQKPCVEMLVDSRRRDTRDEECQVQDSECSTSSKWLIVLFCAMLFWLITINWSSLAAIISNLQNTFFAFRDNEEEKCSGSVSGGDYRVLTSTPSQKQSRLQLDKRYLSIRKTIFSKSDSSTSGNENFPNSLLDGPESKNSLPAVIAAPSISPEHQRMLLLKVWLLN